MTSKIKLPINHPNKDGRICTECSTFKKADQFTLERNKNALTGIQMRSKCKDCENKRKYKRLIEKLYQIDYTQYELLLESQNYKCAICESKIGNNRASRLFVDHCHDTLKVRGLLCSNCNHGLGQFKDSPKLLQRAISYLTSDKD